MIGFRSLNTKALASASGRQAPVVLVGRPLGVEGFDPKNGVANGDHVGLVVFLRRTLTVDKK